MLNFRSNEQPIKFRIIAKSIHIPVSHASGKPNFFIVPGIFAFLKGFIIAHIQMMVSVVSIGQDIQTINPLPDVSIEVFFTTIGNKLNFIGIHNRPGSVSKGSGCTCVFTHVGRTIISFTGIAISNFGLHIEGSIFN